MFLSFPDVSMVTGKTSPITKIQFTIFMVTMIE